ncbi:hypothetical protein QTP86_029755 [Hemibagrus guttatus]|nr:hypothetical protein QTP86_029755 [Hemibagrus guttatus]
MVLKKERETAEKIAARTFSQHYLADLLPSVYSKLRDNGYFYDPVHRVLIHDVTSHRQEVFRCVYCK